MYLFCLFAGTAYGDLIIISMITLTNVWSVGPETVWKYTKPQTSTVKYKAKQRHS